MCAHSNFVSPARGLSTDPPSLSPPPSSRICHAARVALQFRWTKPGHRPDENIPQRQALAAALLWPALSTPGGEYRVLVRPWAVGVPFGESSCATTTRFRGSGAACSRRER